jgi:hypothetical protein
MEKLNVMRGVINTEGEKEESTTPSVSKCPNPVVVKAELRAKSMSSSTS